MSAFVVAGLVLGGIYAISAVGLVLTYSASRIFNFGHGAIAYFVAMCFYHFNTEFGWSTTAAAVVSIGVIAPALGLLLWAVLFRYLVHADPAVKLVSTIGLFVAIPPLAQFLFTQEQIFKAPGLAGANPSVHDVLGVPLNLDQIIIFVAAALVAVTMTLVLRYTGFGLAMRAVVDSESMSELVGTNSALVSAGAWAIGFMLAGLAGVLVAPIISLDPVSFALLVIGSFAAVVVARLSSLSLAFLGALLVGLIGGLSVKYLPSSGVLSRGFRPSVPFIVMAFFLLVYARRLTREPRSRDVHTTKSPPRVTPARAGPWARALQLLIPATVVLTLPLLLDDFWVTIVASGVALAVIFLSITVVTGEGGMISLCQITFAGIGAITAAQLATESGWPLGLSILVGGLVAVPFGLLIALPALRLGDIR